VHVVSYASLVDTCGPFLPARFFYPVGWYRPEVSLCNPLISNAAKPE